VIVELGEKKLDDYRKIVGDELEELHELAKDLKGLRILHINSTSFGGGVAELLKSIIPMMKSLGLDVRWEVMEANGEFFQITKKIHNALQGGEIEIDEKEWELYEKVNRENARKMDLGSADVVIVHDPQPAAIPSFSKIDTTFVWRCHIDMSSPNMKVWKRFKDYLSKYDLMLFHMEEYFREEFKSISLPFPPSIDPLSPKNMELEEDFISSVARRFNVDPSRPILTVVARFDPWKDLNAAIDVYRKVKNYVKDLQLLIVSVMASDDPEGWMYYEKTVRHAGEDEDIHFLTNIIGVNDVEVNAFQRMATLGLHTAIKEGFGLVISEIMWKGKPVVARPAGGVKLQVEDGVNGLLAWETDELAEKVLELLKDENRRRIMGMEAKKIVKERFLTTSHVRRYLRIFLKHL